MYKRKLIVKNFLYDGLVVKQRSGFASYTAQFKKWTDDPGVAIFICSDGKERHIPFCQIEGFKEKDYPKQNYKSATELGVWVLMGKPCTS